MDLKTIKQWLWDLAEITALLAAISVIMSVLFGPDVPFFGNVIGNLQPLVQTLGEGGIAVIIAVLVVVAIYSRRK
ncbi:MAG: hypothetical protein VYA80_00480 [Pseudomonadota bacterium]|nr:hypothetical protein [Pseudomonadota bacterium]